MNEDSQEFGGGDSPGKQGQGRGAGSPQSEDSNFESAIQQGESLVDPKRVRSENREAIMLVTVVICGFLFGLGLLIHLVLTGL